MKVSDKQVFLVVGHTGPAASEETMFAGQILAVDHDDAKREMLGLIGDLTVVGATSLEEMKQAVAALERVKSGEVQAPVSFAMASRQG